MNKEKDFFYQASGIFLTENLTANEFDHILSKGDILPVCSDYESWDKDYLEERIFEVAGELQKAYEEGKNSSNDNSLLSEFISLCEKLRELCTSPNTNVKDSAFNTIKDDNDKKLLDIYFSKDFEDWSIETEDLKYVSWTDDIAIKRSFKEKSIQNSVDLLHKSVEAMLKNKPRKRSLDISKITKTKQ